MIFYKAVICVFVGLVLCACDVSNTELAPKPVVLDKESVSFSEKDSSFTGTGRILFTQPLFGLFSTELYFLDAELFNEDSSLLLHSHFTGFSQLDGIKVIFTRDQNTLTIQLATPSYPAEVIYTDENHFLNNKTVKMYIKVRNGSARFIHVKIWAGYINRTGYIKQSAHFFALENLLATSDDFIFYSKGQGLLWGVDLKKAKLIQINRRSVQQ